MVPSSEIKYDSLNDVLSHCGDDRALAEEILQRAGGNTDKLSLDRLLWEVLCERGPLADPAFEAIYRNTVGRLTAIAVGILHNPEDGEEAVQDAFTKFYRNPRPEKEIENSYLDAYLSRIAINCALDLLRKRNRRRQLELSERAQDDDCGMQIVAKDTRPLVETALISSLEELAAQLKQLRPQMNLREVEHCLLRIVLEFAPQDVVNYWRIVYSEDFASENTGRSVEHTRWYRVRLKLTGQPGREAEN